MGMTQSEQELKQILNRVCEIHKPKYTHKCPEWDGLEINEFDQEFNSCLCYPEILTNIIVSYHAVNRYKERTGCKKSDMYVRRKILEMYKKSEEVVLKKKFRVLAILNHNMEDAKYYKVGGFILVKVDDTIKTIHTGLSRRWQLKE